jgi:hypothetical protein
MAGAAPGLIVFPPRRCRSLQQQMAGAVMDELGRRAAAYGAAVNPPPPKSPFDAYVDPITTENVHATLGQVRELDLGGRGIRDIAWSPAHREYFIGRQVDDDDTGPGSVSFDGRATIPSRSRSARSMMPNGSYTFTLKQSSRYAMRREVPFQGNRWSSAVMEQRRCRKAMSVRTQAQMLNRSAIS